MSAYQEAFSSKHMLSSEPFLEQLEAKRRQLIELLLSHLAKVSALADTNRMSSENLGASVHLCVSRSVHPDLVCSLAPFYCHLCVSLKVACLMIVAHRNVLRAFTVRRAGRQL